MYFFKYDSDSSDLLLKNRVKYFNAIYIASILAVGFYIFKYNFHYHFYQYNKILIPPFLLYLLTPLYYKKTKNILITQIILYTIPSLELIFLVWTAGGLQAPGVFWLTAISLTAGIFFGAYGNYVGTLTIALALLTYWLTEKAGVNPNFIKDFGIYESEKRLNLFSFLIYSAAVTHYFIKNEKKRIGEVQESKAEVESLLRILIHDVATPLTVVQMETFRLKKNFSQEELRPSITRIERSAENLSAMLTQIRELKSLKDGKAFIITTSISVNDLVLEAIDLLQMRIEEKNIKLNVKLPIENIKIDGSAVPFRNIVVMNLLTNAIKFSSDGAPLSLTVASDSTHVEIRVQDFGVGIPPEILAKIFSMNSHTTRTGTKGEKGTGYGMPLVKEYVTKMHGTIEIESHVTPAVNQLQGTLITMRFPLGKLA